MTGSAKAAITCTFCGEDCGHRSVEIEAARSLLDASAGILGAYQVWRETGNGDAAERLDDFDAAWAALHRLVAAAPLGSGSTQEADQ